VRRLVAIVLVQASFPRDTCIRPLAIVTRDAVRQELLEDLDQTRLDLLDYLDFFLASVFQYSALHA